MGFHVGPKYMFKKNLKRGSLILIRLFCFKNWMKEQCADMCVQRDSNVESKESFFFVFSPKRSRRRWSVAIFRSLFCFPNTSKLNNGKTIYFHLFFHSFFYIFIKFSWWLNQPFSATAILWCIASLSSGLTISFWLLLGLGPDYPRPAYYRKELVRQFKYNNI